MKWLRRYNESRTITATDETIGKIVFDEIMKLGNGANLNHIDVHNVTRMVSLFSDSFFYGDISLWDVGNVTNMSHMFSYSKFNGDLSKWNVGNVRVMKSIFFTTPFIKKCTKLDII